MGSTPATLLFGIGTSLPNDFFNISSLPSFEAARKDFLSADTNPSFGPKSSYKLFIPSSLKSSDYVWIQSQQIHHFNPRYTSPFKVFQFQNSNTVIITRDLKFYTINLENKSCQYKIVSKSTPIFNKHNFKSRLDVLFNQIQMQGVDATIVAPFRHVRFCLLSDSY